MSTNGEFQLWDKASNYLISVGVSGNAKQRRLYVRRWKKQGYVVKQFDAYSRETTTK